LKALDGGSGQRLITRSNAAYVQSWTPDGAALAVTELHPQTGSDIWVLPVSGDRQPIPVLTTRFNENHAEFSPNGRWLAYVSDESDRRVVYVQPYPGPGARTAISTDSGTAPAWSRDGRELFFMTPPTPGGVIKMRAVSVTTGPTFTAGTPRTLFEGRFNSNPNVRQYDVSPDGRHFLMLRALDRPALKLTHMILVQNWLEELKQRVPTR
jgi:Tol biopolymer transport system component